VGLPCRLVRGSSYTGKEDDAMVVVKCGDDRYFYAYLLRRRAVLFKREVWPVFECFRNWGSIILVRS
jgi:hypothetical protein